MATIHELHKKLVNKEISAVELTNAVIAHKAKVEPTVHAYLSDSHDRALATAKTVDELIAKGEAISPLAGIPGAIKDTICIKDEPATCASKMLENFVPPYNATVIERLQDNHYISLGKLNMDEFAMGGSCLLYTSCVGATAVLIPKRHNAPINATVAKTSAGAIEQIPLVQVGNVAQTIKQLQKQGFWVMGAHMEGDRTLYEADMTIPTVIVIGNEGKGISRVVKEACDFLVTIPMYGNLNSLNASVAAAVLMYEAVRQRQAK